VEQDMNRDNDISSELNESSTGNDIQINVEQLETLSDIYD